MNTLGDSLNSVPIWEKVVRDLDAEIRRSSVEFLEQAQTSQSTPPNGMCPSGLTYYEDLAATTLRSCSPRFEFSLCHRVLHGQVGIYVRHCHMVPTDLLAEDVF
jgi:hypothetical protein